jgi:hypothetical protein
MSGMIELTSQQLKNLAEFLDSASKLTRDTKVSMCAHGSIDVSIEGQTLQVEWQDERGLGQYVVKDLIA